MKKFLSLILGIFGIAVLYVVLVSLFLPVTDPLVKADAIVAVSGGDTLGRTKHAIALYQEGYAPKLI